MRKDFREIPSVVKSSFMTWGAKSVRYSRLFKTLDREVIQVANDCFDEIKMYIPGAFEIWRAREHNRYIWKFKQKDLTILHELVFNFLCDLVSNRLGKEEKENGQNITQKHNSIGKYPKAKAQANA